MLRNLKELLFASIALIFIATPVYASSDEFVQPVSNLQVQQRENYERQYTSTAGSIVGESIILSTSQGNIMVTPHTLTASGWVKVDFLSKSITGPIDVSFGFLNTTQNIKVSESETWETYAHNLTRIVDSIKETTFTPEKIITKTAIAVDSRIINEKDSGIKVDLGSTELNPNIDTITFETTSPMDSKVTESTQTIAYTSEKDGVYTYKYTAQVAEPYVETYADWKPVTFVPKVETKSLANATKWNTLPGTKVDFRNAWYSTRFWVEVPFNGFNEVSGKYNVAIKSAGADLNTAIVLDPWYSSSWKYRKQITVTNASASYQTKIVVGYNLTAVGENVDCGSKCNTTFDDLRFTGSDGNTTLDYWIEYTNTTSPYYSATVWVENDATPSSTLYMYYGNAGASAPNTSHNMGVATFTFFDDFTIDDDGSNYTLTNKWEGITDGRASVGSGILTLTANATSIQMTYGKTVFSGDIAMRASANLANPDFSALGLTSNSTNSDMVDVLRISGGSSWRNSLSSTRTVFSTTTFSVGSFQTFDVIRVTTGTDYTKAYYNNVEVVGSGNTTNVPLVSLTPMIFSYTNGVSTSLDWVLMRKYNATEPSFAFGAEETSTWHQTGWSYRKPLFINSTTEQTNYQVKLDIPNLLTGGTITADGLYTVHTFTSNGTFTTPKAGNVSVLVVAGGGGGGGTDRGGGGGAGGYRTNVSFPINSTSYSVVVGAGGAGGTSGVGTKGYNSSFSTIVSTGGGTGAIANGNGTIGGSGGGSQGAGSIGGTGNEGGFTPVEGYKGGDTITSSGTAYYIAAGGGGAGGVGGEGREKGQPGGAGGIGLSNNISGASVDYAGGGGGGSHGSYAGNATHGGGAGAFSGTGTSGTANTGGGGGGGKTGGGAGGSGIVIVRYLTSDFSLASTTKFNSDFSDLRFVTPGNITCDYWIETYTASTNATVWVEVPTLSVGNNTIYMYYGNAAAPAVGTDLVAGKATFPFFDDFNNGTTLDPQWNSTLNSPTVASGYLVLNNQNDSIRASGFSSSTFRNRHKTRTNYTGGYTYFGMSNSALGSSFIADDMVGNAVTGGNLYLMTYNEGASVAGTGYGYSTYTPNTTFIYESRHVAGLVAKFYVDDTLSFTATATFADEALYPRLEEISATPSSNYVDWFFVSNYAAVEPNLSSSGAEESQTTATGPTVATIAATSITNTTAVIGGNVTAMGSGNVSQYGLQYGTSSSYGSWINSTELKTAVFSWTNTTTGLTPGLGYYFRPFANDTSFGIAYGASPSTFLTAPNPPNTFATAIINSTALNLTWVAGTGATNVTVRYNTTAYPTTTSGTDGTTIYNGPLAYFTHTSLSTGTPYYYSAWSLAINSTLALTQYSTSNVTATGTPNAVPTVATIAATTITNSTAVLGGNITSLGGANVNYFGFQYGTSSSYGTSINNSATISSVPTAWTNTTSGLTPGTGYYFRPFGQNSVGAGYGSQATFLTLPNVPTALSASVYNATALNVTWAAGTGATNTFVRFNTTGYPSTTAGTDGTTVYNGTAGYYLHTGLTTGVTYYYSAWAWTSNGTLGLTQYSATYTTSSGTPFTAPVVLTLAATSVNATIATTGGNCTSTGGSNIVKYGTQYGLTGAYGSFYNITTTSAVPFSWTNNTLTALTEGTLYYYRAFVTNAAGDGFGAQANFLTNPNPAIGLIATPGNTTLNMTWTNGAGYDRTIVRYSLGAYPANVTDGSSAYNGTGTNVLISSLTNGLTYYVRAWSETSEAGLVQYSTPIGVTGVPVSSFFTVSTTSATSSTTTTLIVGGNITAINVGHNVTTWGVQFGSITGTYTGWANSTGYLVGADTPYLYNSTLSLLNAGDAYYYRAFASDIDTTQYGSESKNVTKPYSPTTFAAIVTSPTSLTLSWLPTAVGAGATGYTYIRYKAGDYPSSVSDGTFLCNTTGTTYLSGGLTPGHAYFYRAWSYAYEDGVWSEVSSTYIDTYGTSSYVTGISGPALYENACSGAAGMGEDIWGPNWNMQTFNVTPEAHTVTRIKLKMQRVGAPGTVTVSIMQTSAGNTTGVDLCYGSSDGSIMSTSYAWYEFTMNAETSLIAGNQYAIVVKALSGSDPANCVQWAKPAGLAYSGGSPAYSVDNGYTWTGDADDHCFDIYGYPCLEMVSTKVFSSYQNSGDWLIACHYRNVYPPYFSGSDVSSLFKFQLLDGSTVIAETSCKIWGYRPGSIYLSSSMVAPLEWGHTYLMRITGTFSNAPYAEQVISPGDWVGASGVPLDNYLLSIADLMGTYYGADYITYTLTNGKVFNTEGGVLFNTGIPYLTTIRPDLFYTVSNAPVPWTPATGNQALQSSYNWKTAFGPQVEAVMEEGGPLFGGIDGKMLATIMVVLIYLILATFITMAGQSGAAIFLAFPIFIGAALTGIIPLAVMFVALAVASFLLIYHFWLSRA